MVQGLRKVWSNEESLSKLTLGGFSGGPVVKTSCSRCRGRGFDPCSGNWIPQTTTESPHAAIKTWCKWIIVLEVKSIVFFKKLPSFSPFFFFFNVFIHLARSCFCCSTWDLSLQPAGLSLTVACGLSCPAACEILASRPGIELMFLALEGRFLTTKPPGKSLHLVLLRLNWNVL